MTWLSQYQKIKLTPTILPNNRLQLLAFSYKHTDRQKPTNILKIFQSLYW